MGTLIGESENSGGVSVDPDGVEDRDVQDVTTHDDLVGTGDTVKMGSKVIMWYTAKIFETGEVYDSIDASTGDPVSKNHEGGILVRRCSLTINDQYDRL